VPRIVVIAKANPAQHGATAHAHPSPRITMDALDLFRDDAAEPVVIATRLPINSLWPKLRRWRLRPCNRK
jgi:hypothetical protein